MDVALANVQPVEERSDVIRTRWNAARDLKHNQGDRLSLQA